MATAPNTEAVNSTDEWTKPPFLRRVRIRGYKSIAFCDVTLEPLTILVGRNASGKSNFLDALAFLRDVVVKGVREAVKLHGGHDAIPCSLSSDCKVGIEVEVAFAASPLIKPFTCMVGEAWTASFVVEIDFSPRVYPRIVREGGRLTNDKATRSTSYTVEAGRVVWEGDSYVHPVTEWPNPDRVLLSLYGASPFEELVERIESIETYNFNPEAIRRPQKPAPGGFLERDGSNLASVIETTREAEEWAVERAGRYLVAITKTAEFAGVIRSGGYETLRFRVAHNGDAEPLEFPAASMSDGTLRAFAALVAAFQLALPHGPPSIVAIEEPETALHPAAMQALVAALDEATLRTQILLTTHSPDLLDAAEVKPANVRVVQMIDGQSVIGPVDEASVEIVGRNLSSLGGLERENQLEPDFDDQDRQRHLSRNGLETADGTTP
jgi:predicted ATPase